MAPANPAAIDIAYTLIDFVALPEPKFGSNYHIIKRRYGENSNMINDYAGNDKLMSIILNNAAFASIVEQVYGTDYGIGRDRASWRYGDLNYDLSAEGLKTLRNRAHTDALDSSGNFKEFKASASAEEVRTLTKTVGWKPGQLCVVLLSQSTKHSIGNGGRCSDRNLPVYGWFFGGLRAEKHAGYLKATLERFRNQLKKKGPYVWSNLAALEPTLDTLDELDGGRLVISAHLAFALPPPLYPSQKVVDVPQPMTGKLYSEFKAAGGMRPNPALQTTVPDAGGIADAQVQFFFNMLAVALPAERWATNVAALSTTYLRRVLFLGPKEEADTRINKEVIVLGSSDSEDDAIVLGSSDSES